ncbi:methyl-accepting chemotaxis protein [Clostridium sp. Marseille-Q2269]|uniref:methyl-accepting chemotaxis protein n=1 Tax=Clostridium sp. Marseille-Q2269 TaxID=2942205 RepID=UPI002072E23D|nr:methyl-accepting chemotaxis protein [Clostridium sp. Marseille-Q2269]
MKSLKTKLITIFASLIFVLAVVLGVIIVNRVTTNLTKDYYNDLQNLSVEKANYIKAKIDGEILYMNSMSQDDKIIDNKIPWETKVAYFEEEAKRAAYMNYCFVDKNGNSIVFDKAKNSSNVKDREYYKKAMAGKASISDVLVSNVTRKPVIVIAAPVTRNGQVQGVFYGVKEATFLSDIVSKIKYGKTGFGIVVNDKGVTVGHEKKELVLSQSNMIEQAKKDESFKSLSSLIERIISEKKVGNGDYKYEGKKNVVGYSPIKGTNWTVVFGGEMGEVLSEVYGLRTTIIIVSLILIALGIVATYFVSNTLTRPIVVVTDRINKMADLDFLVYENEEISNYKDRKDEVGVMVRALRKMRNNIVAFVTETDHSAQQIVASSQEITATSQQSATASQEVAKTIEDIAAGAENQAKDTETSTVSVDEMGNLLEENKQHIKELNQAAKNIENRKEEGFVILGELVNKTKDSTKAAKNIYDIILNNNKSAEKIESASAMIQSIAEQTNLLALNAAIEAARAGEHGRGFAVVAEEIRNLAEQSNSFTGEIKKVIDRLKMESENAVNKMEEVKEINAYQAQSVNDTEEKFEKIAESIDITNSEIRKVNELSERVNENKEKLVDLMQNLSAIAEENAAGTEQASASIEEQAASAEHIANASEGLVHISEELNELIKKFKMN